MGLMANLIPLQLKMANFRFPPLGARKSINYYRPFRFVKWNQFAGPLLPFAGSAPPAPAARRARHINLVTYAHNLVCELTYFVILLLDY